MRPSDPSRVSEMRAAIWTAAGAAVAGMVAGWLSYRWRQRRRLARARSRGQDGEHRARRWLERRGFTILETQATRSAVLVLDDRDVPFTVRADFVVSRAGRTAVVEVKTGLAASIDGTATRRQLLEYAALYAVDEVYLFDASAERLQRAHFPHLMIRTRPARHVHWWRWIAAAVAVLVGCWFLLRHGGTG